MKQVTKPNQLTPIPDHIKVKKCPPEFAGAVPKKYTCEKSREDVRKARQAHKNKYGTLQSISKEGAAVVQYTKELDQQCKEILEKSDD